MPRDPQVDLIFSHFTPRYVATGVDPNDLERLKARIERWDDWCRLWSEEAAAHARLGLEALDGRNMVTASEAFLRAAIYYHYGKHLFADRGRGIPRGARPHASLLQGGGRRDGPAGRAFADCLRRRASARLAALPDRRAATAGRGDPAGARRLQGGAARLERRLPGARTCDADARRPRPGRDRVRAADPHRLGQGDRRGHRRICSTAATSTRRRVGVVGQSLGAFYAPLAASQEPRIKACIANCGPYDWGRVLPQMPKVSQEVFRVRSHAATIEQGHAIAKGMTLEGAAERITCPLLVVFGGGDRLIPPSEGERLAREAKGKTKFVLYPEGNHVCFNIPYKFRPLTADWMAETLFGK